jgi:2-polyprenyl-3-methyl-5-hydroxy-6-metoxy-1,4-benzoquinol methylase
VSIEAVKRFYDSQVAEEWNRMERHPAEFAITKRIISRWIAEPCARILDAGAGPGRYSLWLASLGHEVVLLDLSERNVAFAAAKALEEGADIRGFHVADARSLSSLGLGRFDHVLLMGPLYHLLEEEDRAAAAREAMACLEPGGLLFAAFISAYAPLLDQLNRDPAQALGSEESLLRYFDDGRNIESRDNPGFTDAYFAKPGEIDAFMASLGLEKLGLYNAESILFPYERSLLHLGEREREACIDLAMRFTEDEACRGMCAHFLYVGRKPR